MDTATPYYERMTREFETLGPQEVHPHSLACVAIFGPDMLGISSASIWHGDFCRLHTHQPGLCIRFDYGGNRWKAWLCLWYCAAASLRTHGFMLCGLYRMERAILVRRNMQPSVITHEPLLDEIQGRDVIRHVALNELPELSLTTMMEAKLFIEAKSTAPMLDDVFALSQLLKRNEER